MRIQIYGPGCLKCRMLEANAAEAARALGLEVEIEKISDLRAISAAGVVGTPGLGVNGKVRSTGRLLSVHQVKRILEEEPSA